MKSRPYAGVICSVHGRVDIDLKEYTRQMEKPDSLWECPLPHACTDARVIVNFDDERFEKLNDIA